MINNYKKCWINENLPLYKLVLSLSSINEHTTTCEISRCVSYGVTTLYSYDTYVVLILYWCIEMLPQIKVQSGDLGGHHFTTYLAILENSRSNILKCGVAPSCMNHISWQKWRGMCDKGKSKKIPVGISVKAYFYQKFVYKIIANDGDLNV